MHHWLQVERAGGIALVLGVFQPCGSDCLPAELICCLGLIPELLKEAQCQGAHAVFHHSRAHRHEQAGG